MRKVSKLKDYLAERCRTDPDWNFSLNMAKEFGAWAKHLPGHGNGRKHVNDDSIPNLWVVYDEFNYSFYVPSFDRRGPVMAFHEHDEIVCMNQFSHFLVDYLGLDDVSSTVFSEERKDLNDLVEKDLSSFDKMRKIIKIYTSARELRAKQCVYKFLRSLGHGHAHAAYMSQIEVTYEKACNILKRWDMAPGETRTHRLINAWKRRLESMGLEHLAAQVEYDMA